MDINRINGVANRVVHPSEVAVKADKSNTLIGYGITDALTKEESESMFVKSINNQIPDTNGNVALKTTLDGTVAVSVNGVYQSEDGSIHLPLYMLTGDSSSKSLTAKMTDTDSPENKVTSSSHWQTGNNYLPPWKMFDHDLTTYWIAAGDGEQWVEYQFDYTVFSLDSIWMRAVYNAARQLENIKVSVSNDGITYITVYEKENFKTKANEEYTVPINYVSSDGFDRVRFTSTKVCENQNYYIGVQEARIYGSIEPRDETNGIVIDMTNYYTKEQIDSLLSQTNGG